MDGSSLRVICGPTAAGKSALALALAERFGAVILSADSRQIYRGFDIGTAKPSPADRARVPHRGIDLIEPAERYSAARWASDAAAWIAEARRDGRAPVVVGGTGLYIRALVTPLFEEPELDQGRRGDLAALLASRDTADLRRWCAALDPRRAHLGRTQLLRAIEVALLSGRRISELHEAGHRAPPVTARYLVVDPGAALAERIERRVRAMLDAGWVDEVRRLDASVPDDAPAWKASGYRVVRRLARGEIGAEAATEAVVIETRQFAKRQRTWFRNQLPAADVTRVDPDDADAGRIAERWWTGEGSV